MKAVMQQFEGGSTMGDERDEVASTRVSCASCAGCGTAEGTELNMLSEGPRLGQLAEAHTVRTSMFLPATSPQH